MKNKIKIQFGLLLGIVFLAAFTRIIPHFQNFSPLGAIGLFGAAHFDKKWKAFLIPIAATWLSDLFINNLIFSQNNTGFTWFYDGFYWQYGSYLCITLTGIFIFKKISFQKVAKGALSSSAIFFIISNFGVWIGSRLYPQNFDGLMSCYAAGIPFLTNTLAGDLFYSGILFGGYYLIQRRLPIFKIEGVEYA